MEVLRLDEDVGIEQVGHQSTPRLRAKLAEGLELREAEQAKRVPVQGMAFERAGDEGPGKAFADPGCLCTVEVATALLLWS